MPSCYLPERWILLCKCMSGQWKHLFFFLSLSLDNFRSCLFTGEVLCSKALWLTEALLSAPHAEAVTLNGVLFEKKFKILDRLREGRVLITGPNLAEDVALAAIFRWCIEERLVACKPRRAARRPFAAALCKGPARRGWGPAPRAPRKYWAGNFGESITQRTKTHDSPQE